MKRLISDETKRWCLDPNLVMNLRHETVSKFLCHLFSLLDIIIGLTIRAQIKRRKCTETIEKSHSPPLQLNGFTATEINERENLRQVDYLNRELSKYKERLESMRPKQGHVSTTESTPQKINERKCRVLNVCEDDVDAFEMANLPVENGNSSEFVSLRNSKSDFDSNSEPPDSTMNASVVSSPPTENADSDIRPMLKFSIQKSVTVSRHDIDGDSTVTEVMNKEILTPNDAFDGALSLDHHMSIFIRRLDLCESNESMRIDDGHRDDGTSETASIIKALFDKKQREHRILLQKYFMRWVHFTTIEKLTKRNPDQTRLKKMEIFLQNITLERKKTLQKLKAINGAETKNYSPLKSKFTTDSPELLARKFNNK